MIEDAERDMARLLARSPAALRELAAIGRELARNPKLTRDALRAGDRDGPRAAGRSGARLVTLCETAGQVADDPRRDAHDELARTLVAAGLHRRVLDRAASAAEEGTFVASALRAAQARADRAKARLVAANMHVARAVAHRYRRRGADVADLLQEGTIGLVRAGDKFDHRQGFRFGTYAAWWVRQQVMRALVEHRAGLRIPLGTSDARQRIARAARKFEASHGRVPTTSELANASGLAAEMVASLRDLRSDTVSLHDAHPSEEGGLEDRLADRTRPAQDDALAGERMKARLLALLGTLPARDAEIIRLRFGLSGDTNHSLQQVGERLRLSRERVRRLEVRALRKLHELSSRENLDSYLR